MPQPQEEIPKEYADAFEPRGFILKAFIGSGAFGRVYRAEQRSLGRDVAVKVFDHPVNRGNEVARARFTREAQLLARVQHPSIPTVLTCGSVKAPKGAETPYIVMQFIDGENLGEILRQKKRLKAETAVQYIRPILDALDAIHKSKIFHRDVKPDNIVVRPNGHCYLVDFGIGVSLATQGSLTRVTDANQPGSHDYMAPELKLGKGQDPDPRSEVYAAGVTLFEMLAGHSRVHLAPLASVLPDAPKAVTTAIAKACNTDPEKRFQQAQEFLQQLDRLSGADILERTTRGIALCVNYYCNGAVWNKNGYFPRVVKNTTDAHCEMCGESLTYPCTQCGRAFHGHPYCGRCGHKHFVVPTCSRCGEPVEAHDYKPGTIESCSRCPPIYDNDYDFGADPPF